MPSSKSNAATFDDRSAVKGISLGLRPVVSSFTVWLACLVEVACWAIGAYILYWQVPQSVAAIRAAGVEIPESMVRVISISSWIVNSWRLSLPLILAGIIAPKVVVFSSTQSPLGRIACILIGWAVPVVMVIYGLGLPKMFELGIWP